jgi:hypothetical protein
MKHPVMDGSLGSIGDHAQDVSVIQPSFERSVIRRHMDVSSQTFECPLSGRNISSDCLVLNKALQWKIKYWVKKNYGSFENANAALASTSRPDSSKVAITTTSPPSHFYCPLSKQIMDDPVHAPASSVSYERIDILKWLDASDDETCPVSGTPLRRKSLVRNTALAQEIDAWYQQRQQNKAFSFKKQANPLSTATTMAQVCGTFPSVVLLDNVLPFQCAGQSANTERDCLNSLLSILDEAVECCN